jgi:hypothetical protein
MVCATFLLVGMVSVYCRDAILEGCCERLDSRVKSLPLLTTFSLYGGRKIDFGLFFCVIPETPRYEGFDP